MKRNANVGSKLLALIAVPAVVLVAIASMGARDRLDQAEEAQVVEDGAVLAATSTALVQELQVERLISARVVNGDDAAAEDLAAQRAVTDEAIAAFTAAGAGLSGDGPVGQRYDAVVAQLETLTTLRSSVDDGSAAPEVVLDAYTTSIDGLLELDAELASTGGAPELAATLIDTTTLARAKEARALRAAEVAAVATVGEFRTGDYESLAELQAEEERQFARLGESQDAQLTTAVRNAMATEEVRDADALLASVMDEGVIGGSGEPGVSPEDWQASALGWLAPVRAAETSSLDATIASADATAFEADKAARLFLIGTAAAVILSLLMASLLARRINRRLQRLTVAANELATVELPRLVDDLRSPGESVVPPEPLAPIEVDSNDEIGQLAEAFNAIQAVTAQVAEEQAALLRRGIADIFVNLARRNQSLLDRQIEFIDELETHEQDPDQLENLFKLDHLATRMRRNAESLLVLAGAEPPRRRARPVELADVVRVAIGEVEDFTRINLLSLDEITIGGNAAVDLAHLLSELMENATQFSPPDSTVEVVGSKGPDGDYTLTVADRGIGMSAEQLAEANALLAAPPPVGLALSRSLGFIVVGRLARRLQVHVRLMASPAGGITAAVHLPAAVVAGQQIPPQAPGGEGLPPAPQLTDDPRPLLVEGDAFPAPAPAPGMPGPADGAVPAGAPATLADALPDGEAFDRGLAELVGPEVDPNAPDADVHRSFWGELADDAGPAAAPEAAASPAWTEPPAAPVEDAWPAPAPPAPEPVADADPWAPSPAWMDGELPPVEPTAPVAAAAPMPTGGPLDPTPAPVAPTTAPPPPLTRRQPQATMAAEAPTPSATPRTTSTRRSPEEVRAMLSRYRRGIQDGRNSDNTEDGAR